MAQLCLHVSNPARWGRRGPVDACWMRPLSAGHKAARMSASHAQVLKPHSSLAAETIGKLLSEEDWATIMTGAAGRRVVGRHGVYTQAWRKFGGEGSYWGKLGALYTAAGRVRTTMCLLSPLPS